MEYELIREIINPCAGDRRPEVLVSDVENGDLDTYVRNLFAGQEISFTKIEKPSGSVVYELATGELKHRLTFTP
ncbi:MAG: hypothetical protein LBO04_00950 [Spirochaetaceae bacterium]|jgi:hypothetical protein|nr:hypothetical protein [Spirochaetaceae bacterium]